jgi:glycosyltransferase involved in cell wall biosynthesis
MKKVYINGKFLVQRTTGVQRFARGVVTALDQILQASSIDCIFELLLPPRAEPMLGLQVIRQRRVGRFKRSAGLWEQLDLPAHALDGTLLCLTGSAPLFVRECVPTIHDAAIYLHPEAYSRWFVFWYRLLFKRRARQSPLVLTVSQSSSRELSEHLPSTTFRVVPNSGEHIVQQRSDPFVLKRFDLRSKKFLLAVGSLNPTKNFPSLVNAYIQSSLSNDLPLVIVGSVNRDVFRSFGSLHDHPMVIWVGGVSDAKLRALYENAAAFVFPSLYEGFGIPPLEAMQCGCPVVASQAPAVLEVCGDAAVYFDHRDYRTIAPAIESLLQNVEQGSRLIKLGRQQAAKFSWDISAERLLSALVEFGYIGSTHMHLPTGGRIYNNCQDGLDETNRRSS